MTKPERRLPTRRDAVANRERLLVGAEDYFAELGIDAPLHGLADRVGVGIGTVYRNFPSHPDLVRALYDRIVERFDVVAEECAQQSSGWDAIETLIRRSVQLLVAQPATASIMRRQHHNDPEYQPGRKWSEPIVEYVQRAKDEGRLRGDVTATDIATIPFTMSSIQTLPMGEESSVPHRLITLMLDGLRAHPHEAPPIDEDPLSRRDHYSLVHGARN